jgi:hypothetical protein
MTVAGGPAVVGVSAEAAAGVFGFVEHGGDGAAVVALSGCHGSA